jgi:hypothetical protein
MQSGTTATFATQIAKNDLTTDKGGETMRLANALGSSELRRIKPLFIIFCHRPSTRMSIEFRAHIAERG